MSESRTPQVSIFGNLGSDPELKTIPAKTVTREIFNPAIDDVEVRELVRPERSFLVFSIGVNGKDDDGGPVTSWVRCVDWHRKAEGYRVGDRVRVTGFFKHRSYVKEGETRTVRELVVVETRLERRAAREQAAIEGGGQDGAARDEAAA